MQFSFTSEQQEFRAVLRRYFEETSPTTEVRRLMETADGWDRDQWRALNDDLGLCGVHVPEDFGGQGFGFVELGIVVEEMGRALVCAPFFGSAVLATTAILNTATDDQKRLLLPPIVAGECVATLALAEPGGGWAPADTTTAAVADGAGFRLNGVKSLVLDGSTADLLVVVARRPGTLGRDGVSVFSVRRDAKGVQVLPQTSLDPTRKLARVSFDNVEAELLGALDAGCDPIDLTLSEASAMLANEMVGGAERLREAALDYAKMRMQFGRPIASFQSMKHKHADMLLEVELAKSAAYYAAAAADDGADDFLATASLAKSTASDTYLQTAIHAIQIHGGIGFTWDNDTQLWFKRAKSSEVFLGDAAWHRERMLQTWPA